MATLKDLGTFTLGVAAGKLIKYGLGKVVPAGELIPGVSNKTLANVGVGAGLAGFAYYNETRRFVGTDVGTALAVAGLDMAVTEVADMALGAAAVPAARFVSTVPSRAVPKYSPDMIKVD